MYDRIAHHENRSASAAEDARQARPGGQARAPLAVRAPVPWNSMREHTGRRSSLFLLLLLAAILAAGVPLLVLNGGAALLATSAWHPHAKAEPALPAASAPTVAPQSLEEAATAVAQTLELRQAELLGVGHTLGVLDAMRRAVAALPAVASSTASVAISLNSTRDELTQTTARLDAAFESIERLERQVSALQEPWSGHAGELKCASGHRCVSYIDAGKFNLTALSSVSLCGDYCTRTYPNVNFWAFHNEHGYIAFMLDPKGRCRCFDTSPCELVSDGGYNLWTNAARCSVDLLEPSRRAAVLGAGDGG